MNGNAEKSNWLLTLKDLPREQDSFSNRFNSFEEVFKSNLLGFATVGVPVCFLSAASLLYPNKFHDVVSRPDFVKPKHLSQMMDGLLGAIVCRRQAPRCLVLTDSFLPDEAQHYPWPDVGIYVMRDSIDNALLDKIQKTARYFQSRFLAHG